jgi:uncharacterized membrane protein
MPPLPTKSLERLAQALARFAFHVAMWAGVWLMWSASASYWELGEAHPFFLEKLPLAHPKLWLIATYVHVPSALIALPACLLLLVARVRTHFPAFHRWLGRVTGALVLCAVVPSGMYLAAFTQGGLLTTLGFWLTGLIAFVAMLKSIRSARRRDMRAHRRFSAHVAAQLSVAVLSRFLLVGAEELGWYGESVYTAALFVPVLGSALVAELWTGRRLPPTSKGPSHEVIFTDSRLDTLR